MKNLTRPFVALQWGVGGFMSADLRHCVIDAWMDCDDD